MVLSTIKEKAIVPENFAYLLESDEFKQATLGNKEMQMRILSLLGDDLRNNDPKTWGLMLTALVDAGTPVAHLMLSKLYLEGDPAFGADTEKALHHLTMSADLGDVSTMAQLGAEYEGLARGYSGATGGYPIEINFDEAKKWYRRASDLGNSWASEALADLLLAGRRARDCSREELAEIEALYKNKASGCHFKLGSMYCVDKNGGDCTEEEVVTAKRWYLTGGGSKFSPCKKCTDILRLWGEVELVPRPKADPWTMTEVSLSAFALIFWGVVGTFLAGVAVAITSVTLPLIIGGAIIYGIYRWFKSR